MLARAEDTDGRVAGAGIRVSSDCTAAVCAVAPSGACRALMAEQSDQVLLRWTPDDARV